MGKEVSRRAFVTGLAGAGAAIAATGLIGCAPKTEEEKEPVAAEKSPMSADDYFGKWAFEIAPEGIGDDQIAETVEAEVVVVGAGTAGLVTANSAVDQGLDVILISASSIPIGRGGSNHATWSKAKERLECPIDTPVELEREIRTQGSMVDARKWYNYYNNSEEAMNWLIDIMEAAGFETVIEARMSILEDGAVMNCVGAHGWVNAENPVGPSNQPLVVRELARRLEEKTGKAIYYKHIGRQLVRGGVANGTEGRVDAIIAEREDGSYVKFVGNKAIVLATGDFSCNADMMAKYAPEVYQFIDPSVFEADPDYDKEFVYGGIYYGDGQKMGLWVGGAWQKGWTCGYNGGGAKSCPPVNGGMLNPALCVSRDGKRFCNEYANLGNGPFTQFASSPGHTTYSIWDTAYARKFPLPWLGEGPRWVPGGKTPSLSPEEVIAGWDQFAENGMYTKADTLEELIELMGLPAETLDTIKHYNEMCAAGEDTDFHKDPSLMIPVEEGPFYCAFGDSNFFLTVLGGLRTSGNMEVCDADDNPIPGLFNVGSMAGDMFHAGYTAQLPGLTLGSFIAHGYMLGKFIKENA